MNPSYACVCRTLILTRPTVASLVAAWQTAAIKSNYIRSNLRLGILIAMLTLRQLRYLDALAANGHFGRAASALGVTQPALSVQVRELERALGGRLVDRMPGGARLTPFGNEIAGRSAGILAAVRDIEQL